MGFIRAKWVVTPAGTMPLGDVRFYFHADFYRTTRPTPGRYLAAFDGAWWVRRPGPDEVSVTQAEAFRGLAEMARDAAPAGDRPVIERVCQAWGGKTTLTQAVAAAIFGGDKAAGLPPTRGLVCGACGVPVGFADDTWRWTGEKWQHSHNDVQAGHFDAVASEAFTPAEQPITGTVFGLLRGSAQQFASRPEDTEFWFHGAVETPDGPAPAARYTADEVRLTQELPTLEPAREGPLPATWPGEEPLAPSTEAKLGEPCDCADCTGEQPEHETFAQSARVFLRHARRNLEAIAQDVRLPDWAPTVLRTTRDMLQKGIELTYLAELSAGARLDGEVRPLAEVEAELRREGVDLDALDRVVGECLAAALAAETAGRPTDDSELRRLLESEVRSPHPIVLMPSDQQPVAFDINGLAKDIAHRIAAHLASEPLLRLLAAARAVVEAWP
jgi:hypothetical protein